ncbi:MAG: 50S ribosomal protein L3 [Chloroflexi bacterium]|nr:50S ribosomal protein L3 [Chloroflexota bacterium]
MTVLGLLGKKIGMVQLIQDDGRVAGCTVLEVGPCPITQIRTDELDGYQAVQLGFGVTRDWKVTKAQRGHSGSNGALRHLAEFPAEDYSELQVGQTLSVAEVFEVGDRVDVQGVGKGKGFAGSVKRHHFAGGPKTHGQSDRHRAPGSIGAGSTPGRVLKGTRMAGRMGGKTASSLNLEIVRILPERGLIFVNGSVPGSPTGLVRVRQTKRRGGPS